MKRNGEKEMKKEREKEMVREQKRESLKIFFYFTVAFEHSYLKAVIA